MNYICYKGLTKITDVIKPKFVYFCNFLVYL